MSREGKTDTELIAQIRGGDQGAYAVLFSRHRVVLFRAIRRILREESLAEDVVQDAFLKAYEKLESFEGRSSFKSWLFRIAINTAHNVFRTRSWEEPVAEPAERETQEVRADEHLDWQRFLVQLRQAITALPERQRFALELRFQEGLDFSEIAVRMQCPYDTAKANFRHGFLKVQDKLVQKPPTEAPKLSACSPAP